MVQDVAAGKTRLDQKTGRHGRRIVRGGKGAANRAPTLLSKMFALAEDWGYRPNGAGNPCRMVERFDESADRERARFLSDQQLARLGEAPAAAETADPRHRVPANIVRLLLLTGARKGEIVGLRHEYIDHKSCRGRHCRGRRFIRPGPVVFTRFLLRPDNCRAGLERRGRRS